MTLKKVDIVAPSGNVLNIEEITRTAALFIARDWKVELGTTIYSSYQRFAGETDRQRLNDFNYACTLGNNQLVLAARGGYGMNRLLPYIDYEGIKKAGTWVAGFSDVTVFTLAYLAKCGGKSFQAPSASVLGNEKTDPWTIEQFFNALMSRSYSVPFSTDAADMQAEGILWGGNLSVLVSLLGTEFFPRIKKGILFLEDVAEPYYKVERDLMHLKYSGVIDEQSAIVLGQFSKMRKSNHDFGYDLDHAISFFSGLTKVPVVDNLPFGHVNRMTTLVVGSQAKLRVRDGMAILDVLESAGLS